MAEYPLQFIQLFSIGNATTCGYTTGYGLDATWLNLMSTGTDDFYFDFTGAVATTCHYKLAANTQQTFSETPSMREITVYTTSTAATNKLVRVIAMGNPP